ncbi:MAG: phosphonate C-P lyase system protein PhnH [Hyphomonadaceae bacterium]|nr:MAG: PhnH protein [Caulobacteraceae bacterium]MBT9445649.1 phosphonate C-P lyase system protein PhnH [Hyphomonadaceae bacterium]TPW05536.1 MAG: PhnH protein [Alphaproteobacteria bacterium]
MTSAILDLSRMKPAFADPTSESQFIFRKLLDAMSQPGTLHDLSAAPTPPPGVSRAAAAVILTLSDQDASLWLDPALRGGEAETWFRFHCGASLVTDPAAAAFAVICHDLASADLRIFNQGDAKYPDCATTVIVETPALEGGAAITLSGPGIQSTATVAPAALDAAFWRQRAEIVSKFQFGVDLFITAGDRLFAMPRTTRVNLQGV